MPQRNSIWSTEYKLNQNQMQKSSQQKNLMDWYNTVDQKAILHTSCLKKSFLVEQQDNFGSFIYIYIYIYLLHYIIFRYILIHITFNIY